MYISIMKINGKHSFIKGKIATPAYFLIRLPSVSFTGGYGKDNII